MCLLYADIPAPDYGRQYPVLHHKHILFIQYCWPGILSVTRRPPLKTANGGCATHVTRNDAVYSYLSQDGARTSITHVAKPI